MNHSCFRTLTGHDPFPWQESLYTRFVAESKNNIPAVASIPTGLGKTSVIAVWLLAWLERPDRLPRRLVYVVNRRTVVDQTTAEVIKYREAVKKLDADHRLRLLVESMGISTLRGQFADNQEWSADPSKPAVICGTVDMIGSRLLFSGYRIGFKSRPLHAGLLGQDALLVHDEAHLEPAFQKLIEAIKNEQFENEQVGDLPWTKLRVMALSATARDGKGNGRTKEPFKLTETEKNPPDNLPEPPTEPIHHVWRRLKAKKVLALHKLDDDKDTVAKKIAKLAGEMHKDTNAAVLVFARTLNDIETIEKELRKTKHPVVLLTGTMRGYERDQLVKSNPVFARFLPESDRSSNVTPTEGTVYLVCTSAGEVGINISADHMVCDLSTFDSMAQRLGRVNRFGDRNDTRVDVAHPETFGQIDKKSGELKSNEIDKRRQKTLDLLKRLPSLDVNKDDGVPLYDASPVGLDKLDPAERLAAFAPEPIILRATDILFDAWAMTTIREKMPGRQPVAPYLHGVEEWEPPRTSVAWREEVERITDELIAIHGDGLPQSLLDDYPLKPHELLSDTSERVYQALEKMSKGSEADQTLWLVGERGDVEVMTLRQLFKPDKKRVVARIAEYTILLPPSAGGLSKGMLEGSAKHADDVADEWYEDKEQRVPRRVRVWDDDLPPNDMALIRTIDTDPDADDRESVEDESESPSRGRFWHWYASPRDAEDATRASTQPVTWNHHTRDVVGRAKEIVEALNLPDDLKQGVILAAELHDLGKKRELWQRGIGNPNPTDWHAKGGKPDNGPRWRPQRLSDYRHEFGSIVDALDPQQPHMVRLNELTKATQDLVLHLIAAHHGRARPHFDTDEAFDPERSIAETEALAVETPRRFARLQRKYGRWGLAYLESLLRAADWAASSAPSDDGEQTEATP